jgi:hypothetical protein
MTTSKEYKDSEGNYLAIDVSSEYIRIAWYFADSEFDDFGLRLGEGVDPVDNDGKRIVDNKEQILASKAVEAFAEGKDLGGYYFKTEKEAEAALKAVNKILLSGEISPT